MYSLLSDHASDARSSHTIVSAAVCSLNASTSFSPSPSTAEPNAPSSRSGERMGRPIPRMLSSSESCSPRA